MFFVFSAQNPKVTNNLSGTVEKTIYQELVGKTIYQELVGKTIYQEL